MGTLRARRKKAKAEAETKKAATEAKKAVQDAARAVRDLSAAGVAQLRDADLDERAEELAARLRDSDMYARARERSSDLADRVKDSDVVDRVRDSDTAHEAAERLGKFSDDKLSQLGGWLGEGRTADKLGVRPKRRFGPLGWAVGLVGVAAGFVAGALTAPKRGADLRDDLTTAAERLAQNTPDLGAPAAQKPLADEVRTRLGQDPRTAGADKLNVNVADGTVFIRGPIPTGVEENSVRAVAASVPGVTDVDLELTTS